MEVYRSGEVAGLAGVSIRTLHHYDEIGLLVPQGRSEAGYRLYSASDLERLQHILLYRVLGFRLDDIRALMDDPSFDRQAALRSQRELVKGRLARLGAVLNLIDKTLASMEGGIPMAKEEMFEVFGDFDPGKYEEESRERWGDTEAYMEASGRTARYSKEDWRRFKEENEKVTSDVAALIDQGIPATDRAALEAVERHRLLIDRWFYPCPREMHAELGRMYVADPRFTATYESVRPGMAEYLCEAMAANAARTE
jgi:DNA-binding transcriptional MerR regulator